MKISIPKLPASLSSFNKPLKKIEMVTLVIFLIFLFFPFRIPASLASLINSPLGFLVIFVIIVFLFIKAHPAVAVLYLFVAYELVRRSGSSEPSPSSMPLAASKTEVTMHPVNTTTTDLKDSENSLNANYNEVVPSTLNVYDHNYAPIGEDSNKGERDKELARIHPPAQIGNTLEEEVIKERVPASALHTQSESSSYSPVYDKTMYDVSSI